MLPALAEQKAIAGVVKYGILIMAEERQGRVKHGPTFPRQVKQAEGVVAVALMGAKEEAV